MAAAFSLNGSNVTDIPTKKGKAIAKLGSANPSGTSVLSPFPGIEFFYGLPFIPNLLHLILTPSHGSTFRLGFTSMPKFFKWILTLTEPNRGTEENVSLSLLPGASSQYHQTARSCWQ